MTANLRVTMIQADLAWQDPSPTVASWRRISAGSRATPT